MLRLTQTLVLIGSALLVSCAGTGEGVGSASGQSTPVELEPVLRFDIVKIPRQGKVAVASGSIERLAHENRWVAVKAGYRLMDKDQFKIGSGASLVVVFSRTERAEFSPAPADRWVQFEIAGE
jgi:hypothetical protein